ncbi:MAG: phosphoglucomutase [Candidatus Nezhaarchaeota archaeon]|nr:phosphoglucomutase [Candidatus Nezhaarchaeota archaeon]
MKKLFSTSGIRGVYPSEVSPLLGFKLGCVLPSIFGLKCVVGVDCRVTSQVLEFALISGLLSQGCEVRRLGLSPLPLVAYLIKRKVLDFGVLVTASHNPPEYNGFKIYKSEGWELMPDQEEMLEKRILEGGFLMSSWTHIGLCLEYTRAPEEYIDDAVSFLAEDAARTASDIKVIVDCCNGPASLITPRLLSMLGAKVTAVNANIDGFFSAREPEPRPDVLVSLGSYTKEVRAHLALAHDGDADRVAILDSNGEPVANDRVIAYMAKRAVERGEGKNVITTVDTSRCIDEVVEAVGGEVIRTRLGKTHVELFKRGNVAIAAEPWKIITPQWGPWADGILTGAIIVYDLLQCGLKLSQLLRDIPSYPQVRESFPCQEERKATVMDFIREELEGAVGNVESVWTFDGVRVNRKSGAWILIRASGTEPKIRLYAEAKDASELGDIVDRGKRLLLRALEPRT